MHTDTQAQGAQQGRDPPRVLQGAAALIVGATVGYGLLIMAGTGIVRANDPGQRVALVAGFGCGYVGPLVLRIGRLRGRGRTRPRWLRHMVLLLVLSPLILAALAFAVLPFASAGKFANGVLISYVLGFTLLED